MQGLFLFFSVSVLVSNLVADFVYSWIDPRVGRPEPWRTTRPARPHPATRRSSRSVVWERRRLASARFWATYRRSAMGLAGLAVLVVFALMAIFSLPC